MVAQIRDSVDRRPIVASIAPILIIVLAGIAVRTPVATAYPCAALLLFLWIVADTLMLSLIFRSAGKPSRSAIPGVLAGASVTVWVGSPSAIRNALLETPVLVVTMAAIVLGHVAWATARMRQALGQKGTSRKERWVSAATELFPPTLVRLAVAEMTIIHVALFRWGGPADVPANARAFAYHRHLAPMCAMLLILSAIEIAVYHLLVAHWSRVGTLVMFVVSDVGFVYLIGLIKSFRFRPVLLTPEGVRVRTGFLIDQFVPLDAIVAIESGFTGDEIRDPATLNAALLAWPNIMLRLSHPFPRRSLLRQKNPFVRVAFRLDNPEPFVRLLAWRIGHCCS